MGHVYIMFGAVAGIGVAVAAVDWHCKRVWARIGRRW